MTNRRLTLLALCAAVVVLCLTSCSSGPSLPQPGSPEFYWEAAGGTWSSGDYVKTLDHLSHLSGSQGEIGAKALPWEIVVASGVSRGYIDLTDACETGIKKSPARAVAIRRQMNAWRATANSAVLELADVFHNFSKSRQDPVPLEFTWPPVGSAAVPMNMSRFASGAPLTAADSEALELAALQRGVMLATARVSGAGEDTAKAQELFKQPKHNVARETFVVGMAQALYDLSVLYGPKKLDTPTRRNIVVTLASDAAKRYPKNKDAVALLAKIQKDTKGKK